MVKKLIIPCIIGFCILVMGVVVICSWFGTSPPPEKIDNQWRLEKIKAIDTACEIYELTDKKTNTRFIIVRGVESNSICQRHD